MNQDVPHAFDVVPVYYWVIVAEIKCQLIDCLTYDFNVLNQSVVDYRVTFCIVKRMCVLVINEYVNSLQYVRQPFYVPNLFSHKSVFYRG